MFIYTLEESTDIVQLAGTSEYVYRAAIGYDDETQHVYSALVIFTPHPAYGDGSCCELVFRVIESNHDGSYLGEFPDGLNTRRIIVEPAQRAGVLDLVCYMVECHIDAVLPPAVEMVTYAENLPEKALEKFQRIASIFSGKGYRAGPADPWHGRWIWMMRLP